MSSPQKLGRYFTLRPETVEIIKSYSEENHIPQGEVIDELVETYIKNNGNTKNSLLAKAVIDEFDTRHSDELSRMGSSTRFTDINVQTLLQALNTIFWWLPNGPRAGTPNGPHQILRDARDKVKKEIAENKEKADNRR